MRVTVFDYGAGNLHSLIKALAMPDTRVIVETDPQRCLETDVLVLPGVGAFGQAAARLAPARDAMRDALRNGLPAIGICLGMQLLFDRGEEADGAEGLGLIPGEVTRLSAARLPHIGWNDLEHDHEPLLETSALTTAYFANGYACRPGDASCVAAWSQHERDRFPAMVRAFRTIGVQFHPEKSAGPGVRMLRATLREVTS